MERTNLMVRRHLVVSLSSLTEQRVVLHGLLGNQAARDKKKLCALFAAHAASQSLREPKTWPAGKTNLEDTMPWQTDSAPLIESHACP
mmetsp:Transcript_66709/g.92365  ORF Transcript_66709/g.92365 Transcript_66709/m.92365 type:complete len:88 (-) Transcript_66709:145-408(-)